MNGEYLGGCYSPVLPFYPFSFWVPLLKPNSRKKGTLIIKGLLRNLDNMKTRVLEFRALGAGLRAQVVGPLGLGVRDQTL